MAAHQRIAELNKLAAMLGTGIGNRRGRKHLDVLAGLLRDDEEPLALVYGLAKDSRLKDVIGVAMATNERFVFYGTLVGKVENVSYPISNITTARVERRITTNELIVTSAGSTFLMRNVVLVAAERVVTALNDAIAEGSKPGKASDPMEQLEALGRLRESGVLTDEEFEEKKAELLKRPSPAPTHVPTPQADAVPVAQSEPAALEPEVVEPSEVAADVTGANPARDAGPNEMKEPMVDDDSKLERLQEALVAAEQKIEQRLEERREAEEAENRKAETAKRISELTSRLEEAEAKLSELDAPDSQEPTKALQKRCRCNTLVDVSSEYCPNCMANMANQFQTAAVWRCRGCEHVVGEHDGSCNNCEAVLYG